MELKEPGNRLAVQLINRLWNIIHHHWTYMNEALHGRWSIFRFYFENVDGFVVPDGNINKKHKNKYKQKYLSLLLSRLEVDMFGGVESRLQFDMLPQSKGLNRQLGLHEGSKCRTSHNVHERFGRCQQGGTFIAATEAAGSFATATEADSEGLGRWSWMKLVGETITT